MNSKVRDFLRDFMGERNFADHYLPLEYLSHIMEHYMLQDTHEIKVFNEEKRAFVFEISSKEISKIEAILQCTHMPLTQKNNIFLAMGIVLPRFSLEEAVTLNITYNTQTSHYSWRLDSNSKYKNIAHQAVKAFSMANIVLEKIITPHLKLLKPQPAVV